jgi:hypothetical protein
VLHQGVGRQAVPVLRHTLAVGHALHLELVADQASSAGASFTASSILDSTMPSQAGRRGRPGLHVLDRLALLCALTTSRRWMRSARTCPAVRGCGVALRHAGGVDQHHLLGRQQVQQVLQRGAVVGGVHRHAQDAAVGAQLLMGAER